MISLSGVSTGIGVYGNFICFFFYPPAPDAYKSINGTISSGLSEKERTKFADSLMGQENVTCFEFLHFLFTKKGNGNSREWFPFM